VKKWTWSKKRIAQYGWGLRFLLRVQNWESYGTYGHKIGPVEESQKSILCDPQTSGGLLIAVMPDSAEDFVEHARANGLELSTIGEMKEAEAVDVVVS
jgi:selenide,water dikinase